MNGKLYAIQLKVYNLVFPIELLVCSFVVLVYRHYLSTMLLSMYEDIVHIPFLYEIEH